ncbi:MAG TPA: Gldg family protein [Pontiella sp.]
MKRFLSNINAVVAVFLALIVIQMIGFIGLRNPVRANLSGRTYYELSEKTLSLLDELDQELLVTVFFQEEHQLYHDIENLLEEYQYHSRNIKIEFVDPVRDLARTEKLAGRYKLNKDDPQVVVFDIGGRSVKKNLSDIADFVMVKGRRDPVQTTFKGEQAFSSAVLELLQGKTPKVYFLVGHGERRVTDFDQMGGFSRIGEVLLSDNLEVKELMLGVEKQVPDDAGALVIAGPTKALGSVELEMIEDYLSRSGRVMVMLDALKTAGMESLLRRWGVGIRQDFVVDPENTLRGTDVHVRRYNAHPISMSMNSIVQFILPRSVQPLVSEDGTDETEDRPLVVPLCYTSEESWSETQVEEMSSRYDEGTGDLMGPVSLGVAVERGATQEMLDVEIASSRMVVFGDSDFVGNGSMVGGNVDLFMNAMNWLLDREELMAIAPKPVEEVKLSLSRKQLYRMFWVNVAGIPSIAVIFGLFVWARRRK